MKQTNRTNRNILLVSLFLLLTWFVFCFCWGERVKENSGLGWDGVFYAQVALNPLEYITNTGVNNYQFVRLLPSILVHYSAKLVAYQLIVYQTGTSIIDPEAVIHAFIVYNCLLIMLGVVLLYLIAEHLAWEPPVLAMSIASLFINFPVLKLSNYNPTLTDISALTLSLLIFYTFLKSRQLMLFLVSMLAAFSWPTMIYTSVPLLIFGVRNYPLQKFEPSRLLKSLSAIMIGILTAGVIYDHYIAKLSFPNGANQVNEKVIALSIFLFFLYMWQMLNQLLDWQYVRSTLSSSISVRGIFLAITLLCSVKLIIYIFSKGTFHLTPLLQIRYMGQTFIVNPLVSVVAHVSYFGPVVILTLLFWKKIVVVAKQYGLGLMAIILLGAFLSTGSESRQLMAIWPIFAIMTCETLNRSGITWNISWALVGISLLISRCWLPINGTENWVGAYTEFPYQMIFMNFGPWLSNSMYSVFAFITLILFFWLFLSKKFYAQFDTKPIKEYQDIPSR